jgi:hypothetical protein
MLKKRTYYKKVKSTPNADKKEIIVRDKDQKETYKDNSKHKGGNPNILEMGKEGRESRVKQKLYLQYRREMLFDAMAKVDVATGKTTRELIIDKMNRIAANNKGMFEDRDDLKVLSGFVKILSPEAPRSVSVVKSEFHEHYKDVKGETKEEGPIIDITKMPGFSDIKEAKEQSSEQSSKENEDDI